MAFYAVKKGRVPGVYTSWPECKEQIDGFSGADYKKFTFEPDAWEYVTGYDCAHVLKRSAPAETPQADSVSAPPSSNHRDVYVYTDGACSGNPGPGGWGFVVVANDKVLAQGSGGLEDTTNNQMELMAVIEGLRAVSVGSDVVVTSDSSYVVKAFNNHWIEGWRRQGWRKKNGEPVANEILWKQLLAVINKHKSVRFVWVKGHAGHKYNELCDQLATAEIRTQRKG